MDIFFRTQDFGNNTILGKKSSENLFAKSVVLNKRFDGG